MNEYYDTQILADISWTSLSSEVNNLPLIYTELENYFFTKFEGWQLSHRCTCILNLQLRLYEVNRWWSERCFPFVAQTRNKPLNFWSLSTRVFSAPLLNRWTRHRFVSCRDLMIGPDHRSDHRGALSQVFVHSLSTSHLMFIRIDLPDTVLPMTLK